MFGRNIPAETTGHSFITPTLHTHTDAYTHFFFYLPNSNLFWGVKKKCVNASHSPTVHNYSRLGHSSCTGCVDVEESVYREEEEEEEPFKLNVQLLLCFTMSVSWTSKKKSTE